MNEMEKRVKRWEKKGYKRLSITEACLDCFYRPRKPDFKPTLYFNYESGYVFCPRCGVRRRV